MLTFHELRIKNIQRCEEHFKHTLDSWSLSDWAVAMIGEAGEACNIIKKLNRIRDEIGIANRPDPSLEQLKQDLADELADTITYIDLLAASAEIDLEKAVKDKFNRVSERVKSNIKF